MKRKLLSLLTIICMFITLSGCDNTNNDNDDLDVNEDIYLTIDVYSLDGILEINSNDEVFETMSYEFISEENATVETILKNNEVDDIQVINENDTLEGWLIFKVEIEKDDEGFDIYNYTLESDKIYSYDEILAYKAPNYHVMIAAKWASIDSNEYFNEEDIDLDVDVTTSGAFVFNANEGIIQLDNNGEEFNSANYTFWLEEGQCINDILDDEAWYEFKEVVKEGSTFEGWQLFEGTSISWSFKESSDDNVTSFEFNANEPDFEYIHLENCSEIEGLKTTDEINELVVNGECYYAVAVWK